MKIGILTLWDTIDNYGQQLQIYAAQTYLKKQGHEPFLIKYNRLTELFSESKPRKALHVFNPSFVIGYIKRHIFKVAPPATKNIWIERGFSKFRDTYIASTKNEYNSLKELRKNPPAADAYLTGSDQVWNIWGKKGFNANVKKITKAFMLDFGDKNAIRGSFSASWGRTELTKEEISFREKLFKKFDYVSVREKSGIGLCEQCGYKGAHWTVDPTLHLKKEDYEPLLKTSENRYLGKKNYIFFYYLNNGGDFNVDSVYEYAKSKGLEVIYVSGNGDIADGHKKDYPAVEEWLYLVANADYVVTNSFHCCVFALLLEKRFAAIRMTGPLAGMNTRIDSMFEVCHVSPRYVENDSFADLDKDVEKISIDEERLFDASFLERK